MFSPCHPKNPVCDTAFTCCAMRQQAIEDIINELAEAANPNDTKTQQRIFQIYGVEMNFLTDEEISYIEQEVSTRLR